MLNENQQVVLEAENIIKQANNPQLNRIHFLNKLVNANRTFVFSAIVDKIVVSRPNDVPLIIFSVINCKGHHLSHTNFIARYTKAFVHLKEIKRNDAISFVGKLNLLKNRGTPVYSLTSIKNVRYISTPDDLVLRRVVPSRLRERAGYVLLMDEPPLTDRRGRTILNYPLKEKNLIKSYLKWLKR